MLTNTQRCTKVSIMEIYSISEMAKKIGKSVKTLQRWDRNGILVAKRTCTNRRYYTDEDIQHVLQQDCTRNDACGNNIQ